MLGSMGLLFAITKFGWIGELLGLNGVIAAYLLGGMGVGSFESNLVASISPLGPSTKLWAIVGLPLGFNVISVVGYLLMF